MNVFRKILKNQKGFSILQAIMAAGALGVASVGVMKLSENQAEEIKFLETKQEEEAFVKQISNILLQENACSNSFAAPVVIGGVQPTVIRSATGTALFTAGTGITYGGGAFRLNSMNLVNLSLADGGVPAGGGNGIVRLELNLARVKRRKGVQEIRKSINLKVTANAALTITNCNTDISGLVTSSLQEICNSLDGLYDVNTRLCDLSCPINSPTAGFSASCLSNRVTDSSVANYYDGKYILKTGGSIAGNLTLTGTARLNARQIRAASEICIGAAGSERCRDLSAQACPNGSIIKGVNTDGSPVCEDISCNTNQYFAGLDTSGNKICKNIPEGSCSAGQLVAGINNDGSLNCVNAPTPGVASCPNGQYLGSIQADGSRTCIDDKVVSLVGDCPPGEAVSSISGSHVATCAAVVDTNVFNRGCSGTDEFLRGFEDDGTPVCETIGSAPATYACTDSVPLNATGCSVSGLTSDKAYVNALSCSGGSDICEFSCDSGYTWDGSSCAQNTSVFDCSIDNFISFNRVTLSNSSNCSGNPFPVGSASPDGLNIGESGEYFVTACSSFSNVNGTQTHSGVYRAQITCTSSGIEIDTIQCGCLSGGSIE